LTTIATKDGVMACDSQVSGDFLGSEKKIYRGRGMLLGICGDFIAATWLAQKYIQGGDIDPDKDFAQFDDLEIMVLKRNGLYLMDMHLREVKLCSKQYAIGSGSQAAMVAMNMGATAKEAIKEAMKVDPFTGGRIRSYKIG
jgi:hypothetical protein